MGLTLHGMGTALPEHGVSQALSAQLAQSRCLAAPDQERLLPTLYRRSGVKFRNSVLLADAQGTEESQTFFPPAQDQSDFGPTTRQRMEQYEAQAAPLALIASRQALRDANISPADIAHLITVSCTGFVAPGVDIRLIKELQLSPHTSRTQIGFMGCHGAFNGLRVASSFSSQGSGLVLICAVELCSLHFGYGWNPQQIVANSLFADGAGAVVAGPAREANSHDANAWTIDAHGSCLIPDSEDAMTWLIGDHGFSMTLSPRVPELITTHLRPWLQDWLGKQGLSISQVQSWAVHPGGPRILHAVAQALTLPMDQLTESHDILSTCGNMSSPTILFILDRLRTQNAPRPCVALGFGPGLTIEAMLLR